MIKSYCHQDVEAGIRLLKTASAKGYVRSSYALGLVLRDSQPNEAHNYMKLAAGEGYLPALQELLPAREMKAKYGEPNADELRRHLDPICLNRLLGRHYVQSAELRELSTSHCWNPLCGRWAFKATVNANAAAVRLRRPWGWTFYRNGNGEAHVHGHGHGHAHHAGVVVAARNEEQSIHRQVDGLLSNHVDASHGHGSVAQVVAAAPLNGGGAAAPPRNGMDIVGIGNGVVGIGNDNSTTNAGPRAGPADADTRVDSSGTSDESSQSQPGNHNHNADDGSGAATSSPGDVRVSRMKMCSRCCRAKYCSKLCQVYDWRSGRHKMECQFL
jgi:MYND finger